MMSNRSKTILLFFVDLFILMFSLTIVICVRKMGIPSPRYFLNHYQLFSMIFPFWLLMYFIEGLYTLKTYNPANLPISLMRSTLFGVITSFIIIYFLQQDGLAPKTNLILLAFLSFPLMFWWRSFFFTYFSKDSRLRETLLIGSCETLELVNHEIKNKPHLGYKIIGTYSDEQTDKLVIPPETGLIAIERNMTKDQDLYRRIFSLLGSGVEIIDLAKFAEQISGKIPLRSIDESWFIDYCGHQESKSYDFLKRIIDCVTAILLLILLIPLAFIVLPVLLIIHGRPIFFSQKRTGTNNVPFILYKLRTMVIDAEKNGAQWATPKDARVTPLGSLLRKTRIDELPQLINIIKGEMSLVGPRPERPEIIESQLAPSIPYYSLRHLVKPGVTGWAQVTFRYGFSQEDSKEKLQYDLFYVKNRSLWLDILVLIKTTKTVFTGAGQ